MTPSELQAIHAYWRAANYLTVGQIYLLDNPLLRTPLLKEHIKPRLLGHWGTSPGLNLIYAHLNRIICKREQNIILLTGPGHGGPAIVANTFLEGTFSELYTEVTQDVAGLTKLCKQFSFPGGIPSHTAAEVPGSIHEGGELGYVLAHAYGAVFDHPDLVAVAVVGDGEAETGALATSWHSNKFLNPQTDGAVLPILHLNGYKIANPTVLARISEEELLSLFRGYGYNPYLLSGDDPMRMHQDFSALLDRVFDEISYLKTKKERPRWPMIILRTPKGWTGPKEWEGKPIENSWRAHQVPLTQVRTLPAQLQMLQDWMLSYKPEELFDAKGKPVPELSLFVPKGEKRIGASPYANGGLLLRDLKLPDFRKYAVAAQPRGAQVIETATLLGAFLRDVMRLNDENRNFRVMGPDETASNRLQALFEATSRTFLGEILPTDTFLSPEGRVMEILSEHMCQGWLEGYLLTGRHGFFSCYEAFIHIVDSMFNQYAKWLKTSKKIPWRRPIASLNYFLTSHVWRQDHNGFSHQDPGFIDHVANKKAEIVRIYLPPDGNTLLSVADHCLRSRNYVNVIIAGKQPALQYLTMDEAIEHCTQGIGIWPWAGNEGTSPPDIVMACCGDVPTLETLAAVELLYSLVPSLKIRVVNVVDLMALQSKTHHPHGLNDQAFADIFTETKPVLFTFHGYPWLIHRLIYNRRQAIHFHVHGYREEGTTTTPFDMCVLNGIDRYHLALSALDCLPALSEMRGSLRDFLEKKLIAHKRYITEMGDDPPEIKEWKWKKKRCD
ncbi:MAG: phosphoketolase family protein [Verrucomicrobiota bacterium]|nr:phosphoketolase family protein [Verrucomicrobiota bacterium]